MSQTKFNNQENSLLAAAPSATVNIAFMLNNSFVEMMLVTVYSIAKNTKAKLAIYIVDCGISEVNQRRIEQLKQLDAVSLVKIKQPKRYEVFEKASRANGNFPSALFYRLSVPQEFPELDRCLVLDSDLLFLDDVVKLFNEDLHGKAFGVMNESEYFGEYAYQKRMKFAASKYFNIGVMLIDCKRFTEIKVLERVLEVVTTASEPLLNLDQDALNFCIHDDEYQPLPPTYNFLLLGKDAKKVWRGCDKKIMVVHYAGLAKPYYFSRAITEFLFKCGLMRFVGYYLTQYWRYADATRKLIPLSKGEYDILYKRPNEVELRWMLSWLWKLIFQPLERWGSKWAKHLRLKAN